MNIAHTAWKHLALTALAAVSALPLCASIPRELRITPRCVDAGEPRPEVGDQSVAVQAFARPMNTVYSDGTAETFKYDALNRLVSRSAESAQSADEFSYDAVGNLLTASNAASRLAFAYDTMNRLASSETRVSGQVFGVGYAYDLGGLCTNVTYPGGKAVRYGYDADGRVTNVTDWAGRSFAFTRDAAGRLTALSCPNGVAGAWTHDARHSVASWSYNNGSPIAGRTITRDEAGIKTKEQVTAGLFPNPQNPRRAINTFDAADRLTSATVAEGTNTYAETYLYDGNGALTNRYSEIGGQRSEIGEQRYEYDCAGRMTFASTGGAALSVTYDALGNRLTTYSANASHIWITDHADPRKRPLMEADSNGTPVRYFIWGCGMLLAVVEADGTMRYCHSDEQGSVVALTDSNGAVTDQYCYGPYGTDWGHTGTNSIPFRWLGSHGVFAVSSFIPHPSSLYLTRHRAYDAGMGRFLSSDPLGLGGGPNLYAYCMGNPLAYIDPLGLGGEAVREELKQEIQRFKDDKDKITAAILEWQEGDKLSDYGLGSLADDQGYRSSEFHDLSPTTQAIINDIENDWILSTGFRLELGIIGGVGYYSFGLHGILAGRKGGETVPCGRFLMPGFDGGHRKTYDGAVFRSESQLLRERLLNFFYRLLGSQISSGT